MKNTKDDTDDIQSITNMDTQQLENNIDNLFQTTEIQDLVVQTHNGRFHADDTCATVLIMGYYDKCLPQSYNIKLVRSRNPETFEDADVLLDVGCIYDPSTMRFDHHQKSWEESFSESYDIPMSSVGMIWKHYGKEILEKFIENNFDKSNLSQKDIDQLHDVIYKDVIMEIDANDNGIPVVKDGNTNYNVSMTLWGIIDNMNYTETYNDEEQYKLFLDAIEVCRKILDIRIKEVINRYLLYLNDVEEVAKNFSNTTEKYLILERPIITIFKCLNEMDPELNIKFIIFPNDDSDCWTIRTRSSPDQKFKPIIPIVDNVKGDVLFVHRNRFVAKTKTKDAAIALIQQSILCHNSASIANTKSFISKCIESHLFTPVIIGVGLFTAVTSWWYWNQS